MNTDFYRCSLSLQEARFLRQEVRVPNCGTCGVQGQPQSVVDVDSEIINESTEEGGYSGYRPMRRGAAELR